MDVAPPVCADDRSAVIEAKGPAGEPRRYASPLLPRDREAA